MLVNALAKDSVEFFHAKYTDVLSYHGNRMQHLLKKKIRKPEFKIAQDKLQTEKVGHGTAVWPTFHVELFNCCHVSDCMLLYVFIEI